MFVWEGGGGGVLHLLLICLFVCLLFYVKGRESLVMIPTAFLQGFNLPN